MLSWGRYSNGRADRHSVDERDRCIGPRRADYLVQLDAAIGDGDHGINLNRGFRCRDARIEHRTGRNPWKAPHPLRQDVGVHRRRGKRSTLGIGASQSRPRTRRRTDLRSCATRRRDGSCPGVDPGPRCRSPWRQDDGGCARAGCDRDARGAGAGASSGEMLRSAAEAAEAGMRATIPMQARKGRASYLGERSIGHQDPGATSTALIMRASNGRLRALLNR